MKKLIPLILTATLTLAACAAPAADATPTPDPTLTPESTTAPTAESTQTTPFYGVSDSFNSGDAYYSFTQKPGYALLLKTDYATATQSVFCTVPGCTHDSETCPAYFPGCGGDYRIVNDAPCYVYHPAQDSITWDEYYDGYVKYAIEHPYGIVADFTPEEVETYCRAEWEERNAPAAIYAVDPAAGKTYTEVQKIKNKYGFAYSDGTALYGRASSVLQPDATPACRLDLATGQAEEFTLLPTEQTVGIYGDGILTARYVADAPLPTDWEQFNAAIQTATLEFDCWDPRTGTRTKLAERPYNGADMLTSGYDCSNNGLLYFTELKDLGGGAFERLGLTAIDPATGTTETIWDTWPDERAGMSMPNIMPAHGDRTTHWFWLLYNNTAELKPESHALVNTDTWEIFPLEQTVRNDDMYVSALAQTNDGRLLVWTGSTSGGYCNAMGLIAPEKLAAGSTDWQEVTMWQ